MSELAVVIAGLAMLGGSAGRAFDRLNLPVSVPATTGHRAWQRNRATIPDHRELAPGTLRELIRAAGVTVEEFRAALG